MLSIFLPCPMIYPSEPVGAWSMTAVAADLRGAIYVVREHTLGFSTIFTMNETCSNCIFRTISSKSDTQKGLHFGSGYDSAENSTKSELFGNKNVPSEGETQPLLSSSCAMYDFQKTLSSSDQMKMAGGDPPCSFRHRASPMETLSDIDNRNAQVRFRLSTQHILQDYRPCRDQDVSLKPWPPGMCSHVKSDNDQNVNLAGLLDTKITSARYFDSSSLKKDKIECEKLMSSLKERSSLGITKLNQQQFPMKPYELHYSNFQAKMCKNIEGFNNLPPQDMHASTGNFEENCRTLVGQHECLQDGHFSNCEPISVSGFDSISNSVQRTLDRNLKVVYINNNGARSPEHKSVHDLISSENCYLNSPFLHSVHSKKRAFPTCRDLDIQSPDSCNSSNHVIPLCSYNGSNPITSSVLPIYRNQPSKLDPAVSTALKVTHPQEFAANDTSSVKSSLRDWTYSEPSSHTIYTQCDNNAHTSSAMSHEPQCHSSITSTVPKRIKRIRRHVPHSLRSPAAVDKRNSRERRRIGSVNQAFEVLRQHTPTLSHLERASKISILRQAQAYIRQLSASLA